MALNVRLGFEKYCPENSCKNGAMRGGRLESQCGALSPDRPKRRRHRLRPCHPGPPRISQAPADARLCPPLSRNAGRPRSIAAITPAGAAFGVRFHCVISAAARASIFSGGQPCRTRKLSSFRRNPPVGFRPRMQIGESCWGKRPQSGGPVGHLSIHANCCDTAPSLLLRT